MNQQKLVNDKDAAKYLDLATQTLRNWRFLGKGPRYIKMSKRCVRYKLEDLEAWVNQHAIDTEQGGAAWTTNR